MTYSLLNFCCFCSIAKLYLNLCDPMDCSTPDFPEKAMAPHSGTLAWKIPWMEQPGRLQSKGSLRVGHD